jgi:HAD superfamily hydrolase (TIGR01484 family)
MQLMQPFSVCSPDQLATLRGVLTDIDDTISTEGRISAEAYCALENIRRSGLILIPVTGRPAGWCDHIARMWPVDAVVGENGAFWFRYEAHSRRMERCYMTGDEDRRAQRGRLQQVAARVLREVPGAGIAADQLYREADLAIDYCEDVARLSDSAVDRIVSIMRAEGLTVKVSSIHVNGWYGTHDKLSTTLSLLAQRFGLDPSSARDCFAFVGDSPNDQPMFEYFACSVGVANVREFETCIAALPKFVTDAARGAGFAEFAKRVVEAQIR